MSQFNPTILILLAIAVLGLVSHNTPVAVAMLLLLIIRVTALQQYFPTIEKYGLTVGIIIMLVSVMSPIASGKIGARELMHSFSHWQSLLALAVGITVAWLAGRGVTLMISQPGLIPALMIGTILGVAFFKGVPVGPLIASGILAVALGSLGKL